MDKDKVLNLAKLARIELSNEEAEDLSHEFESILDYVGEVKGISSSPRKDLGVPLGLSLAEIRNVFREDGAGHETGIYTEKLLNEAPSREGNYIKVKKIL